MQSLPNPFIRALLEGLSETFQIPSEMRLLSYLLTGLLMDLPTEDGSIVYGAAYGDCL